MAGECTCQVLQMEGQPEIVAVVEGDVVAIRVSESGVPRRVGSAVCLRDVPQRPANVAAWARMTSGVSSVLPSSTTISSQSVNVWAAIAVSASGRKRARL